MSRVRTTATIKPRSAATDCRPHALLTGTSQPATNRCCGWPTGPPRRCHWAGRSPTATTVRSPEKGAGPAPPQRGRATGPTFSGAPRDHPSIGRPGPQINPQSDNVGGEPTRRPARGGAAPASAPESNTDTTLAATGGRAGRALGPTPAVERRSAFASCGHSAGNGRTGGRPRRGR